MIYRPVSGQLQDQWLVLHEGRYYMYYLHDFTQPDGGVGLATSPDLVHWTEVGIVIRKDRAARWLGSGAVWQAADFPVTGRFIMNFSEWRGDKPTGQQVISFAESTDLIHWQRLGETFDFLPDTRWYNINQGNLSRWDCIYAIPRRGGGFYGYWSANATADSSWLGFGETLDGVRWAALPPARIEWGAKEPFLNYIPGGAAYDLAAVERIAGKYYAMVNNWGHARPLLGTFTFVSDRPEGPFRPASRNYALIASRTPHCYASTFPRFFPTDAGLLVVSFATRRDGVRYSAPAKEAVVDEDGTLRLKWRNCT